MENFIINFWEIISGLLIVVFLAITWKAEIGARISVLEEKVRALFDLINSKKDYISHTPAVQASVCVPSTLSSTSMRLSQSILSGIL